jgi:hypothetical protein
MQPKAPCYLLAQLPAPASDASRNFYAVSLIGSETTVDVTLPVAMLLGVHCQANGCFVNGSVPERDEAPHYRYPAFSVPQAEGFDVAAMADTLAEVLRLPVYYPDDFAAPGIFARADPPQQ